MRENGLSVVQKRKFAATADSDHSEPVFPNLYNNQIPSKPDLVWVGDITYIRLRRGFAYLAALLDACSSRVVGYALSRRMDTELTLAALDAACLSRMPVSGTCIHNTDRGSQYANAKYRRALQDYGLIGFMSALEAHTTMPRLRAS